MKTSDKEYIIHRLLTGTTRCIIGKKEYTVISPTPDILYESSRAAEEAREKHRFEEWLTIDQCRNILIRSGILDPEFEQKIKDCNKTIEDNKVKLFQSVMRPDTHAGIRKTLRSVESLLDKLEDTKNSLNYVTLDGFAEKIKLRVLYSNLIYFNGSKLWNNLDDVRCNLLDAIIEDCISQRILVKEFREIARTEPWRSYWAANETAVFNNKFLNDEQRTIVAFTKMYDNSHKHPECPSDDILNDDDMFDGWMISLKREREKEQMTKALEKGGVSRRDKNSPGEASEIFLPAKNLEEAKRISDLNDMQTKMILKERHAKIKSQGNTGGIEESQLPDQQRNLQHMFHEIQKAKKG